MQKARRHPTCGLRPLVGVRFQVLFTLLFEVLFTFPSQYLFTIGLSGVFSLGGWSPHIQTGFHVSRPTHLSSKYAFQLRDYHSLRLFFPELLLTYKYFWANPLFARHYLGNLVDFFSSGYLDVSVLRVVSSCEVTGLQPAGLSHSDICGSKFVLPIPAAFRSLPRPSSPLKA